MHFWNAKYANSLIPIKHYVDYMPAGANLLLPRYIVYQEFQHIMTIYSGLAVFVTIKYLYTFGTQRYINADIYYTW